MSEPGRWAVEHHRGSATGFHGRVLPEEVRPVLWWFEVDAPAVALGSTQGPAVVDDAAARAAGVEVVRRRSGGGAVWLAPGEVTWVDVLLPAGDRHWDDDVARSATWLGRAWAGALAAVGVTGAAVHTGPVVRTARSGLVCFAGLAPGEVTVDGRKAVGIAQRRTRAGARFQCAVLHRWDPEPLLAVLALTAGDRRSARAELDRAATGIGAVAPEALVAALAERLHAADRAAGPGDPTT